VGAATRGEPARRSNGGGAKVERRPRRTAAKIGEIVSTIASNRKAEASSQNPRLRYCCIERTILSGRCQVGDGVMCQARRDRLSDLLAVLLLSVS
jgi:hypothetical protein